MAMRNLNAPFCISVLIGRLRCHYFMSIGKITYRQTNEIQYFKRKNQNSPAVPATEVLLATVSLLITIQKGKLSSNSPEKITFHLEPTESIQPELRLLSHGY